MRAGGSRESDTKKQKISVFKNGQCSEHVFYNCFRFFSKKNFFPALKIKLKKLYFGTTWKKKKIGKQQKNSIRKKADR